MKKTKLFYSEQNTNLGDAGALVIRQIIEMDTLNLKEFPEGWDPYSWWEVELRKVRQRDGGQRGFSISTIRSWTYDWSSNDGNMPSLDVFLYMIHRTQSKHAKWFLDSLFTKAEEIMNEREDFVNELADKLINLASNLREMGKQYKNDS